MWEVKKSKRSDIILDLDYKGFATLKVEKINRENIESYILYINVHGIINESLSFYKLDDLKRILTFAKDSIEEFEEDINEMSDEEYDNWVDNFLDEINNY